MRNKTIAVFAIGLILLAACGRQAQNTMTESQALDTLTNVTELNSFASALGKKPKPSAPKVSVADLQKLLIQLIQEGKIKLPSQARGATSTSAQDAINAISAIFAAIPQTNGALSAFTLALSIMAQFSTNLNKGTFDLNTVLSILNQALPYIVAFAPQYAPLVQALVVIIPMVVTIINTLKPPTAMLKSMSFNHA